MAVTNDVIKKIAAQAKIPTFRVRAYLKATTDIVGDSLQKNEDVDMGELGKFTLVRLPSRKVTTNFGGKKQVLKLEATTSPSFVVNETLKEQLTTTPESQAPKEEVEEVFRTTPLQSRGSDVQFIELGGKI
ncbi:MAG: HU family DNA-binding protein, partial [Patescibacteria group bacterium]